MHIKALITAAVAAFALASPTFAASSAFTVTLAGKTEVPANASPGMGTVDVTYDTTTRQLAWKGSYSGLTGPVTAAHFHGPADPTATAGVVLPVEAKTSPFAGSSTISQNQEAELLAGKWYFNIHTEQNKGGEVRGQLTPGK